MSPAKLLIQRPPPAGRPGRHIRVFLVAVSSESISQVRHAHSIHTELRFYHMFGSQCVSRRVKLGRCLVSCMIRAMLVIYKKAIRSLSRKLKSNQVPRVVGLVLPMRGATAGERRPEPPPRAGARTQELSPRGHQSRRRAFCQEDELLCRALPSGRRSCHRAFR